MYPLGYNTTIMNMRYTPCMLPFQSGRHPLTGLKLQIPVLRNPRQQCLMDNELASVIIIPVRLTCFPGFTFHHPVS